jgi:hypothetical protein
MLITLKEPGSPDPALNPVLGLRSATDLKVGYRPKAGRNRFPPGPLRREACPAEPLALRQRVTWASLSCGSALDGFVSSGQRGQASHVEGGRFPVPAPPSGRNRQTSRERRETGAAPDPSSLRTSTSRFPMFSDASARCPPSASALPPSEAARKTARPQAQVPRRGGIRVGIQLARISAGVY